MNEIFYFSVAAIIVLIIIKRLLNNSKRSDDDIYPYYSKNILSENERKLYISLLACVDRGQILLAKVRLWDIIDVENINNKQKYTNKIQSKHIDFVIADYNSTPILCIELDDSSHGSARAQKSDNFKNCALASAEIPLLRIDTQNQYNPILIREMINSALRGK